MPDAPTEVQANARILQGYAGRGMATSKPRSCVIRFALEPVSIIGRGRVEQMLLRRTGSQEPIALDCGLVVSSIGRRTAPIPGVPYDADAGRYANVGGRLKVDSGIVPGLYACGWSKRGPRGTIGTNRACGLETAEAVLADLAGLPPPSADAESLLARIAAGEGRIVNYAAWRRIDLAERNRGQATGKPREKFVTRGEMLAVAGEVV